MTGPMPLLGAGSRRKTTRPHHMSPPVTGLNTEEERVVFTLGFADGVMRSIVNTFYLAAADIFHDAKFTPTENSGYCPCPVSRNRTSNPKGKGGQRWCTWVRSAFVLCSLLSVPVNWVEVGLLFPPSKTDWRVPFFTKENRTGGRLKMKRLERKKTSGTETFSPSVLL